MSIAYNNNCPQAYDPPGFIDAAKSKIVGNEWRKMWNETGQAVSTFDSSHHTVSVMARNSTFGYQTASQMQDTAISKELQALQKTSSAGHAGMISTLPAPSASPVRSAMPTRGSSKKVVRSSPFVGAAVKNLKASQDHSARTPSQKSTNSGQGQSIANPLRTLAVLAANRRRREIIPEKLAEIVVQAYCLDFDASGGMTLFDADLLSKGVVRRLNQSATVRCECGYQKSCESMVSCELCDTWQHSECYGLKFISRQASLPSQHLCYSCLLLPKEDETLGQMTALVQMRLALMHISRLPSAIVDVGELFLQVFGTSKPPKDQSSDVIQRLVDEDILTKPAGNTAQILPVAATKKLRLQTEYLDPLAAIAHLYRVVKESRSGSSLRELRVELKRYSGGCDYTAGQGVEDVVVTDSFGDAVIRWGYYAHTLKRKAPLDANGEACEGTPRRRRISISQTFINLDRSTPASSISFNEEEPYQKGQGVTSYDMRSRDSLSTDTEA
jgi:hypothetical protein